MARIPEAELDRLKREISVQRLAEARGVEFHRHGKDLLGLCPFHDDHEPSLAIDPQRNVWHCLGACQTGGSVIDWVMKAEGVSFRHAVEVLRNDGAIGARRLAGAPPIKSRVRSLPSPVAMESADQEVLRQVVTYYHETLEQNPEALEYLVQRGLRHAELLDRFQIGFANRTLGLRLPARNRVAGGELRGRLQGLGILRESGHEHFNGCVVFPLFAERGEVVGLYGRKITRELKADLPRHLYLPGPRRGVFNREGLHNTKEVILCESVIDALTFWCAGFRNVTCAYGVEGFSEELLQALHAQEIERVLIAYDRDDAGDRAAAALAPRLLAVKLAPFRVLFPKGLDANEYALKIQPAEKSLGLVLRHATWLGSGPAPALSVHSAPELIEIGDLVTAAPVVTTVEKRKAATKGERRIGESVAVSNAAGLGGETNLSGALVANFADAPEDLADDNAPDFADDDEAPSPPRRLSPLVALDDVAGTHTVPDAAPPVLLASPDLAIEITATEISLRLGDRRYRVRGLDKNMSYEQLRVNLLVARGDAFHVDTLDLYSARHRAAYVKQAAEELRIKDDMLRKDLGLLLLQLEALQDEQIKKALAPEAARAEMTAAEKAAALELLGDPNLLDRLLEDFARCGVVGEETNKLVGYLAAVSRKLNEPLAVILQSSSAAGKSSLMDAVLAFVPEEERVQYSAMTGQSLFYMGETDLKHKVLAIVEEEGAERASYALKLLQSEGELTIASTGKDPHTGRLVTHEYRVEGPVMIFLTTTAIEVDEELLNRCLVLTVNEDREQTRAIHRLQREAQTLEGLLAREDRAEVLKVHRNAQRLLQPLAVANPFARELTFLDARTRTRRDHVKYLTLIRSIALLHQHQRPLLTAEHRGHTLRYIEATLDDIATANRLAHEILGRSLDDLPPQTRRFLQLILPAVRDECVRLHGERSDFYFTRRWLREATGWTDFQVRTHLEKLVALEYVLVHRGGRGQSFVYELLYDGEGQDGKPFLSGLLDVEALRAAPHACTTPTLRGQDGGVEHPLSPHRAPDEPPMSIVKNGSRPNNGGRLRIFDSAEAANAHSEPAPEPAAGRSRSRRFHRFATQAEH